MAGHNRESLQDLVGYQAGVVPRHALALQHTREVGLHQFLHNVDATNAGVWVHREKKIVERNEFVVAQQFKQANFPVCCFCAQLGLVTPGQLHPKMINEERLPKRDRWAF